MYYAKPLWGEGLFLRPQNFQQQDAYHEQRLSYASRALHPYCWGLQHLKIDLDALAVGQLRILEIAAIFPDGEQLSAPSRDAPPPALKLSELPSTDRLVISLALPLQKSMGDNLSQSQEDREARFAVLTEPTADLYTKAVTADITYLRKNTRLIGSHSPSDHLSAIPILRLTRNANAGYEIDATFMAPALSIQANPALHEQLKQTLDALQAKISALYGFHREPSQHIIEFRSGDVASFWLLHTANAAHAALNHLHRHPLMHPERLFQELLRLAGSLMTFSKQYSLADLPVYRHEQPEAGFSKLDGLLRDLLETVISTRYFSIALNETRPSIHSGRLDSGKIDAKTSLFLAVGSSLPVAQLEELVPLRFKIGSPDDVEKLVLAAMPGIVLNYTPQVPAAIPVKPGTAYFALQSSGPLYDAMLQGQSIAIYAPAGIPDLKLDLVAVTQ